MMKRLPPTCAYAPMSMSAWMSSKLAMGGVFNALFRVLGHQLPTMKNVATKPQRTVFAVIAQAHASLSWKLTNFYCHYYHSNHLLVIAFIVAKLRQAMPPHQQHQVINLWIIKIRMRALHFESTAQWQKSDEKSLQKISATNYCNEKANKSHKVPHWRARSRALVCAHVYNFVTNGAC